MKSAVGDVVAGVLVLAVIYMLVRPSSPAPALVTAVTDMFTGLVAAATSA